MGPSAPGPPGYDRYGQFDSSFIYQQARRDPLPHLVTFDSRASPLVRGSEHHSPSKTYPRLSERDSRPPISSESADIDRVVPSPQSRATNLQVLGDTRSRHICNSVELSPSHSHLVAESVVDSTPASSLCGTPSSSSLPSRSSVPAGSEVCLGWKVIPSARMEALMRHYKAAGFSDEVTRLAAAPKRP